MRTMILVMMVIFLGAARSEKCTLVLKDFACGQKSFHIESRLKLIFEEVISLLNLNMIMIEGDLEFLRNFIKLDKFLLDCVTDVYGDFDIKLIEPINAERRSFVTINAKNYPYKQWHLKRINSQSLPLNKHSSRVKSNKKVHVYIVDSGVDKDHPDLKDKLSDVSESYSIVNYDPCCDISGDPYCDCNGHGTHVAGLVASAYAGYNPNTIIHSYKILDYTGGGSSLIQKSINQLIGNIKKYPDDLAIVNMSFGGPAGTILDSTIRTLANLRNALVVVAAGNENQDACNVSPSSLEEVLTVGSSNIYDYASSYSNYGKCVNFFAPGENIVSCNAGGKYISLSGTSMASPFASGFISLLAANLNTNDASVLKKEIQKYLINGKLGNIKNSPNLLISDWNLDGLRESVDQLN